MCVELPKGQVFDPWERPARGEAENDDPIFLGLKVIGVLPVRCRSRSVSRSWLGTSERNDAPIIPNPENLGELVRSHVKRERARVGTRERIVRRGRREERAKDFRLTFEERLVDFKQGVFCLCARTPAIVIHTAFWSAE